MCSARLGATMFAACAVLLFAVDAMARTVPTAARIDIESVMRQVQARYRYLASTEDPENCECPSPPNPTVAPFGCVKAWPNCCSGSGSPGPYPQDGFYGARLSPRCAVILVQALCDAFWQTQSHLDGPIYTYFVKEEQGNLEGHSEFPTNYAYGAFGTEPVVTRSNYLAVFAQVKENIQKLKYIAYDVGAQRAVEAEAGYVRHGWTRDDWTIEDPPNPTPCPWIGNADPCAALDLGKGTASCCWALNDWVEDPPPPWGGTPPYVYMYGWACIRDDPGGGYNSDASKIAKRAKLNFEAPECSAGTTSRPVTIYLWVDHPPAGESNGPPVASDSKWHSYASVTPSTADPDWVSEALANREPSIDATCGELNHGGYDCPDEYWAIEWDKNKGWGLQGKIAIMQPAWDVAARAVTACSSTIAILADGSTSSGGGDGGAGNGAGCGAGGGAGGPGGRGGAGAGAGPPNKKAGGHASRAGSAGANPESNDPVVLTVGLKVERAVDLSIPLAGQGFEILRGYCSDTNLGVAPALVGPRWTLSTFSRLGFGEGQIRLSGPPLKEDLVFTETTTGVWTTGGPTAQKMVQATATIDSVAYPVWRLIEPGGWEMDFHRGGGLEGRLLQERDMYTNQGTGLVGNVTTYAYEFYQDKYQPPGTMTPRLTTIYLNGSNESNAAAEVDFEWNIDPEFPDTTLGKLASIGAYRFVSGEKVLTHEVSYKYKEDYIDSEHPGDGLPSDIGIAGDLIQVTTLERLDHDSTGGGLSYRTRTTQYRYHRGDDPYPSETDERLNIHGAVHQLKSIFLPEQIEYMAQKTSAGSITAAADVLLTRADNYEISHSSWPDVKVVDLAAKVVSYVASGTYAGRVDRQYLQSSCGCSGATQGRKQAFTYVSISLPKRSTRITEQQAGTSGYTDFRVLSFDIEDLGSPGIPYLRNFTVEEPGTSPRQWVWHYGYDSIHNLTLEAYPSAKGSYTRADTGVPWVYTASTSNGLVYAYAYTGDNRCREVRVANGDPGSFTSFSLMSTATYPSTSSGSQRVFWPTKIELVRTPGNTTLPTDQNQIETTEFQYAFRGGTDAPAWVRTLVEAELESENGPGTSTPQYDTYELYDKQGLNRWSRGADMSVTARTFDPSTGGVTAISRNAGTSSLTTSDYESISISGWGTASDGGTLTTTYTLDLLGRVTTRTSPGGVMSTTVRQLAADAAPYFNPYVPYYSEVSLPHRLTNPAVSFDGPAIVTWYTAADRVLRTSEYQLDPEAAFPPDLLFTTTPEIARSLTRYHLTGLVESRSQWHSCQNDWSYTTSYEYDSLGRVTYVKSPPVFGSSPEVRTITSNAVYDVLGRVLAVEVGTSLSPSNMVRVTDYFYDSGGAATQGVGDGNLTLTRQHTGETSTNGNLGAAERDTIRVYDFRNRPIITQRAQAPHEAVEYDNLGRALKRARYSSVPTVGQINNTTDSARGLYSETAYGQRGLVFRQRVAINPADLGAGFLESHMWYDSSGRTIEEWRPNSPATKRTYDGHGRTKVVFTTDRGGGSYPDAAPGASGNYTDATNVSYDSVLEQTSFTYDTDPDRWADRLLLTTTLRKRHDLTGSTGDLSATSGLAVATYVGYYYDDADRRICTVNFGTNRTDGLFYADGPSPASTWPPATAPAMTSTIGLVSAVTFNARGLVDTIYEPEGTDAVPTERQTKNFYDDLGRRYALIENYNTEYETPQVTWDGTYQRWRAAYGIYATIPDINRVTMFVYDGNGNVVKQIAQLPSGGASEVQVTQYTYGTAPVTSPGDTDSLVASADLLREVAYPDESTGEPGTTDAFKVKCSYNFLGELRAVVDQNQTKHAYTRDLLGRVLNDSATIPGGSVIDTRIKRIGAAYDALGRLWTVKSFDVVEPSTPHVANAVEFLYRPLWQVESIFQDHDSDITRTTGTPPAPTGNTTLVRYAYADAQPAGGSAASNYSRVTSLTYPDGTVLNYRYGTSGTADDRISRAAALDFGSSDPIVAYGRVGMDMFALVDYAGANVQLDRTFSQDGKRRTAGYTTQDAGVYPGWDRYGRVITQPWLDGAVTTGTSGNPNRPPLVDEAYTYDRASNRRGATDARPGARLNNRDRLYEYDGLDRLKEAKRGYSGSSWTAGPGSQKWTLDMLGNWKQTQLDPTGSGSYSQTEDREHDAANQITHQYPNGIGYSPDLEFENDAAGNARKTPIISILSNLYTHDAWNRLVARGYSGETIPGGGSQYEYNGLHWRTVARRLPSYTGAHDGELRLYHYSAAWQVLQETIDDDYTQSAGTNRLEKIVWGLRYIDDPVMRWNSVVAPPAETDSAFLYDESELAADAANYDAAAASSTPPLTRFYHLTDVQFSTVAMTGTGSNPLLYERVRYDAYGAGTHRWPADFNDNGAVNSTGTGNDQAMLTAALGSSLGDTAYDVAIDLNRDGVINSSDQSIFNAWNPRSALAAGQISNPGGADNDIGFDGYVFSPETSLYCVRFRWYEPQLGRWLERDLLEYIDGANAYEYASSAPPHFLDPLGLSPQDNWYDIPSELKNNRDFRKFIECSKEGIELPKGFQYSRKELLQLAEEWASTAKLGKNVRQKLSKALRGMKGGAAGLALVALNFYFLADDAAAAVTDKNAPCRKFLEAIKSNSESDKCNEHQLKTLGEECKWDLAERTAKAYGSAAGTRMRYAFESYLEDILDACRKHTKPCPGGKGADPNKCATPPASKGK